MVAMNMIIIIIITSPVVPQQEMSTATTAAPLDTPLATAQTNPSGIALDLGPSFTAMSRVE